MGYSRPVEIPKTKLDGLCNAIQMAINNIEAGNGTEAVYGLVNLLDDVRSNANPYLIGNATPRPRKREYMGDVNTD